MDKYLRALNNIKNYKSYVDYKSYVVTSSVINMKIYLKSLQELKDDLMQNLNITIAAITIQDEDQEDLYLDGIQKMKYCLIETAINSLRILSKLKNITSESIIASNTELFEKKNSDYGNSFEDFKLIGIIVRLNDKINRILNLGENAKENMQVDEKIEDTINDLYNYCVIGLMYT